MSGIRVVHYLNQFFAGLGGEAHADRPPEIRPGPVGPGQVLQRTFGDAATVVATLACGDNFFSSRPREAAAACLDLLRPQAPGLVVAGPAFNAGRYGVACGALCQALAEAGVPAVTGMHPENPAVPLYRSAVVIAATGDTARDMEPALRRMAALGMRMARGEDLGDPAASGYLPRGIRANTFVAEPAAVRGVRMLLAKMGGEPYTTELPLPAIEPIVPPRPIRDLARATIALVSEGGVVPKGNPDGIESRRASRWGRVSLAGLQDFTGAQFECVHGGFDNRYVTQDPDRVAPLDVLRELEREGAIGKVHEVFYTTVGAGAPVERAQQFGREIAAELLAAKVDGVILTGT